MLPSVFIIHLIFDIAKNISGCIINASRTYYVAANAAAE